MMTDTAAESLAASYDDRDLLELFTRTGDERAFAAIVHRYTDFVFAACLRVLHDRARAEEAAQETFFKLLRQPKAVDRSLAGWLHRVATRHCIDQLRREGRRRKRELAHAQESLQRIDSWGELEPHLDEALDALPDSSRRLLVGHYLRGMTMRQLADERGSSPATVCRHMASALEDLRGQLRRRGILVLAAALGPLLAQQPASAAPATLQASLGKITMLGGASRGGGAVPGAGGGKWLVVCSAAMVCVGIAAGVALWSGTSLQLQSKSKPDPGSRGHTAAVVVMPPTPPPAATPARPSGLYLVLHLDAGDLRSDRVVMVQEPSSPSGNSTRAPGLERLAVVFADSHVRTMSFEEVDRLVLEQTGRPLRDWAGSETPRVRIP